MEDVDWLVKKIANLRVFGDENDVMNRSILDIDGNCLVVSQFTLYASYKKGNRPSWFRAGSHEHSIPLYQAFCAQLSEAIGKQVATGEFGADMLPGLLRTAVRGHRQAGSHRRIRRRYESRIAERRPCNHLYGYKKQGISDEEISERNRTTICMDTKNKE